MSEIEIVAVNLVAMAIAYFFIYPKFAGNDVKKLAWLDVAVGTCCLLLLAPFNWNSENNYTLFFIDLNWWIFAISSYFLLELPLFFFYLKARGLGREYLDSFKVGSNITATASRKSVEKQLVDTKWDGLRSSGALKSLVIGANTSIIFGTVFLMFVGDNIYASYTFIHIILLLVFWFLLRQAVRLIPDAPQEALDERMVIERNRTYYTAYQGLAGIATVSAVAMMGYVIVSDSKEDSDGFNYSLEFTWPQVQAIFWLIYGYAFLLPSMVMAWRESKRVEKLK